MDAADHVQHGREAFARRAWYDAHAALSAADPQDAADLERLATAAYMLAREDEYVNFQTADDRVRDAYGANYERPVELKRAYDPGGMFRSIEPS